MKFIKLESERLIYRKFTQEDFPIVFDWLGNAENMKYRAGEPRTEQEVRDYLNWAISNSETENPTQNEYAVALKSDKSLIGSCCIFNVPDKPEIGWQVHRNYWRQGYGTEMGRAMLKLGFEVFNLHRIVAGCFAENHASYKIMERLGMRREAHYIKARKGSSTLNHEWHDGYQYAILREEWEAMRNAK